jgi:hypothetical protein
VLSPTTQAAIKALLTILLLSPNIPVPRFFVVVDFVAVHRRSGSRIAP